MYEREGKDARSTFAPGDTFVAVAEPQFHQRTPEERSLGARTIARNFDSQLELVRTAVARMKTAAAAADLAAWTAAKNDADQALKQLVHIAQKAPTAADGAADLDVRKRLASADQALRAVRQLVTHAPAAPQAAALQLSCAEALLAALPPDPPSATWRDADFQAAATAVKAVCTNDMTTSDISIFRAIVTRHADHVIARRFRRFSDVRRRQLLDFLDRNDVKRSARDREAARRADVADGAPQDGAPVSAEPLSIGVMATSPEAADNSIADGSAGSTTPEASASRNAAQPTERDPAEPHEALGPAIAAQVSGVTYEGTGRFLVATHERHIEVTIQRVHTDISRIRRDAMDVAVLEIRTGLSDGELAVAVAAQLRGLQQQPGASASSLMSSTSATVAAAPRTLASPAPAGPMQPKAATPTLDVSSDAQPMSSETMRGASADVTSARVTAGASIQRRRDEYKPKQQHIQYKIRVARPMTGEEFKVAAHMQMFGAVIPSDWHRVKDHYTPADSPVEILVGVELFRRGRGAANAARGIETDSTGAVAGAHERAEGFDAQPGSDEKATVLAEIDRRYYTASGDAARTKIRPGDAGRGELWRSIRDEVLFQRAYLGNLPDKVKSFIRTGIAGRELTPADYDQLFRIAKMVERLPPGEAADCASKLTASTADLDQLETTIERYRSGMVQREQAEQDCTAVHNKLVGLEGVYQLYRRYLASASSEANSPAYEKSGIPKRHGSGLPIGEQFEEQLKRYGFASIAEFTSYVARYAQAFEDGATTITLDILARYAGKLHRESQRYQDPAIVQDLHRKLGGFRAQHQEFDKNSRLYSREVWNAQHERDAELGRLPGNGGVSARPPTHAKLEAKQNAEAAKAGAEAQIKNLSKEYPIFAEDDLSADKRIDKVALAQASEAELAGVLQAHIAQRLAAVADARGELEGKHVLVYKMTRLMPAFYAQLGIQPGSIHDLIIQDKLRGDATDKIVSSLLLAIVALALTVVSFGSATPAVLAAGASMGAAGLSTYLAYDEYTQYTADHAIAEAGYANDPSVVWLVLAVVGAGVDMSAAADAIGKIAPTARAFAADGELARFHSAIEALREHGQLDDRIAAAADRAAAARASYAAARDQFKANLKAAASGVRGTLAPFTHPAVYRELVKMAAAKIREGVHSLDAFIAELKQARIDAQLADMSPEELVKAKAAWAQAEHETSYQFVEITDVNGAPVGEFDLVIHDGVAADRFIEDKSAQGLKHPKNRQTPAEWARKQIFEKTNTRIKNLQDAVGVRPRPDGLGSLSVPTLDELRTIREFEFVIESADPDVRAAVEAELVSLRAQHPGFQFTARFGK